MGDPFVVGKVGDPVPEGYEPILMDRSTVFVGATPSRLRPTSRPESHKMKKTVHDACTEAFADLRDRVLVASEE